MLQSLRKATKTKKQICRHDLIKTALAAFMVFALAFQLNLASAATLQEQLQTKQQRLKELNEQINKTNRELANTVKQKNTLQNHIQIFTGQINQLSTQIVATETRIEIANVEIVELTGQIGEQEVQIIKNKQNLAELLREIDEMDRSSSTLLTVLNNDNLSDFLNDVAQVENVQGESYEVLQTIKEIKFGLEENRAKIEARLNDLEELQVGLQDQKRILDKQVTAKNDLLAKTKGQEKIYQSLLAESQAEENQIEKEIQDLENQIRKSLGQRTSPGQKGLFAWWPIKGVLTQRYGRTGFTSLGYTFHNGLDIAAPAGTPIVSVYDGEVTHSGSSKYAYGNWATVKYDLPNKRSVVVLYAHMLKISVSPGQSVKAGQLIGTEGNTGNTTRLLYGPHAGFHLHFTVFDTEGFQVVESSRGYLVPVGYTYDPMDFL